MQIKHSQLILPKKIALAVTIIFLIYGFVVTFIYWDPTNPDIGEITVLLVLLTCILSYFIHQFLAGGGMTVGVPRLEFNDEDLNIGTRWFVFIISMIAMTFFPAIASHLIN